MIPDIKLNGESVFAMGWLRETVEFPVPKAQTSSIVIPGRNSPIRYTKALGRVSYEPRSFKLTFTMLGTRTRFDQMVSGMSNKYNGKLTKVSSSEEPDLYILGTLILDSEYDPVSGKGILVISCEDADSYRYYVSETVVSQTGSGTLSIRNDYMPVVPEIEVTKEATLSWSIGEDEFWKTLSPGKWTVPELELTAGENTVKIEGDGETTFKFREGRL